MSRLLPLFAAALLLAALPDHSGAATPLVGSASFEGTGTVDHVNLQDGRMVVGDRSYVIDSNVRVTLPGGGTGSLSSLPVGTRIGFATLPDASGRGRSRITQIWVLPKDYVPPAGD